MNNYQYRREREQEGGEDVFSRKVRAGKRTYFFDVKVTRNDDYFLTITESRKRTSRDGQESFEKHKIYLYKEDFSKFSEGFSEVINYIKEHKSECFDENGEAIETFHHNDTESNHSW